MKAIVCAGLSAAWGFAACEPADQCEPARLGPAPGGTAYAVVASDYTSTAIALLDEEGELLTEAWVDSGTTASGVSATLSGDVVLPTEPGPSGVLTLIDRLSTNVVTRIALADGRVKAQFPTQLPVRESSNAFRSNPQDYVLLSPSVAAISRFEPNFAASDSLDGGNDIVLVEPATGELLRRLDLSSLDVVADSNRFYARPGRMVQVGEQLVVGLARLDRTFRNAGPGAAALVDANAETAGAIALDGLVNCTEVRRTRESLTDVWVACAGATFGTREARAQGAGVALVEIDAGRARVVATWLSHDHTDTAPLTHGIVPLAATRAAVVAMGDSDDPDALFLLDIARGAVRRIADAEATFVLGRGAWNADFALLLVPDATQGIRRLHIDNLQAENLDDVTVQEWSSIQASPCRNLGAREIALLRTAD